MGREENSKNTFELNIINAHMIEAAEKSLINEPPDDRYPGFDVFSLTYGRKKLTFYLNSETSESHSSIKNEYGENEKKDSETTVLYMTLKKILTEKSETLKRSIHYKILTENEAMAKWAQKHGRPIFNWNHEEQIQEDKFPKLYVFETDIKPIIS